MPQKLSLVWMNYKKNKAIYWMALPVVLYFLVFKYLPMYGAVIAFKEYTVGKGIWGSDWVGLQHFRDFSRVIISGGFSKTRWS